MQFIHNNIRALAVLAVFGVAACGRTDGEANRDFSRPAAPGTEAAAPHATPAPGADAVAGLDPAIGGVVDAANGAGEGSSPAVGSGPAATQPATGSPAAGSAPEAQPRGDATAEEILRRADQAYSGLRSLEADFVQTLNVPLLGTTQQSRGKMYQRRPDRFLMRFTDPAGDVLVADGRHFWMYHPSVDRTQVLRSAMSQGGVQPDLQREFLSNPTERYVATLTGEETVGGRRAHVLTLVPRARGQFRLIRVWVDQQDHLVRRFEMMEENESVRRIELNNLRRNVDLPDSLFQFTPPAGAQIFDQ